jgi:hypothetical protein
MNLASAIAASTSWARCSAPSGLRFGASRDGDLTRPASIAASAIVTFLADFAEIALRGGLDAIGAGTEIDPVEVEFENLGLGMLALQPQRQFDFLQFALQVRSCVRNRFLASCWVSVEPPCETP